MKNEQINYVLDTDTISEHQRGNSAVIFAMGQINSREVTTTIVTMYEQLKGRMAVVHKATAKPEELPIAYHWLNETISYFSRLPVLGFDDSAAQEYSRLVQMRLRGPSKPDLQIAAIALSQGARVVTRNIQDYENIEGLDVIDWTSS